MPKNYVSTIRQASFGAWDPGSEASQYLLTESLTEVISFPISLRIRDQADHKRAWEWD